MHSFSIRIVQVSSLTLLAIGLFLCSALQAQPLDMDKWKQIKPRNIGPAGMSGRVTTIDAVVSNPNIIYAGTASGGLWKSESGGINWTPIFDEQKVASIGAVAIHQANPDIVWAGSGEGNPRNSQASGYGVYRSLDGGKNWTCMGLEETRNIHRVLIHPDNPNIVYVGAQGTAWGDSEHRGVYKTTDGGKSWNKILYVNQSTGIGDLVMDPQNPNKLIAAMWEFRRWPWSFKSGGEGSGLHVTYDGGETWEKRTSEDGLPKGELGRIGLAIAPSSPNVVYALVEAKKNAFYRSTDGGFKWQMVNNKTEIGNRPFYYADIYVDPQNENRIYSLHTLISRSEDGGKSFKVLVPFSQVHPDHHAFWIDPNNPSLLMNGNDGGMAISRDMGKNWRFIRNLPLAQYYHINIDNEKPYNVYGGMQDNGSWRGPAYTWRAGGIRNSYFEELYFGDGFDVVPDPTDASYGYAMSQGGSLGRYNVDNGYVQYLQPVHPDGEKLRFNWNAGIAQDPFDDATIYYGSQFVHKSTDKGNNWTIISPDLTTNDPEKQKQAESGGLTLDVTAAENHTSIITIAPSPLDKNVLWVGTDDGNLQLTRDGGQNWTNLSSRLPGAPANAWIPSIHPSSFTAGEAYVVVNNYRQNDWKPYLYRTRDFGETWESMLTTDEVWGHTLAIVQDPIEARLLFLGTEYGLYVSIDEGDTWTKWDNGYPTVSTIDLKIHPREHDLIVGTFGRAAWVFDDIRPLRALAKEGIAVLDKELHLFEVPDATLVEFRQASGVRFAANAEFAGQNRRPGAMITVSIQPEKKEDKQVADATPVSTKKKKKKKRGGPDPDTVEETPVKKEEKKMYAPKDSLKLEVLNTDREVIRTLMFKPKAGVNRMYWGLDQKGVRMPQPRWAQGGGSRGEPSGGPVSPGTYLLRMSYGGSQDSASVTVHLDPRLSLTDAQITEIQEASADRLASMKEVGEMMRKIGKAEGTLKQIKGLMPEDKEDEAVKAVMEMSKAMQDSLKQLRGMIMPPRDAKGITDNSDKLMMKVWQSGSYIRSGFGGPSGTSEIVMKQLKQEIETASSKVNAFFEKDWPEFKEKVEQLELSPFKE